jgi:hypothetical protein
LKEIIMKLGKASLAIRTVAVAMTLILGASAASAEVIWGDSSEPKKATAITGLMVGGTAYRVDFVLDWHAFEVYGPFPGTLTFNTSNEAEEARGAINAALNDAGATSIGEDGVETNFGLGYNIGYESFIFVSIETIRTVRATYTDTWGSLSENTPAYNQDHKEWAMFSSSVPVESSSWGRIKALYDR